MENKKDIYLCAIEFLKDDRTAGFCSALTKAILVVNHGIPFMESHNSKLFDSIWDFVRDNINGTGEEFLEIKAYRPEDYHETMYWWRDYSSPRRIKILNTVISGMER